MADEIEPYVVYRTDGDQVECAVWRLQEGQRAIALFLSIETEASYQRSAALGEEWKIVRPAKQRLLELFKECYRAGILFAVIDPDLTHAKRIFDLKTILAQSDGAEPSAGAGAPRL